MTRKKLMIICLSICLVFSIIFTKPVYAGLLEDIWDGIVDWCEGVWEGATGGGQTQETPLPSPAHIVQFIQSDWYNLTDFDQKCIVEKIMDSIDEAQNDEVCQDCVERDENCDECIEKYKDQLNQVAWDIILGECRNAPSGYDGRVSTIRVIPANPIARQEFTIRVCVGSTNPNAIVHTWHGNLKIRNAQGNQVYSENWSTPIGCYDFRHIVLAAGNYTATFTILHIYREVNRITYTTLEPVDDSNPENNVMEIPLQIAVNPPTNPVVLSVDTRIIDQIAHAGLSWTRYNQGDFFKYEVHRSNTANFTPGQRTLQQEFRDSNTTVYDSRIAFDTRYYFKVKVCDLTNQCAVSNEVSAMVSPPAPPPEEEEPQEPPAPPSLPDLVISNITFDTAPLTRGQEARINVQVTNQGNVTVLLPGNLELTFNVVGSGRGPQRINLPQNYSLAPGSNVSATYLWTPRQSGQAQLEFNIDSTAVVPESNDNNNIERINVMVVEPQPDLTIRKLWVVPSKPEVGQEATIYAELVNAGNAPITVHPKVKFTVAGKTLYYPAPLPGEAGHQPPPIPVFIIPGGNFTVSVTWTPTAEANNLRVLAEADYPNEIIEVNETNNSREIRINVSEVRHPRPDLDIIKMWVEPAKPRVGEAATIFAKVKNEGYATPTVETKVKFTILGLFQDLYYPAGPPHNPPLRPGGTYDAFVRWTPPQSLAGGHVHVRAKVDYLNEIVEGNESNNTMEFTFDVAPAEESVPSGADLELIAGSIDYSAPSLSVGEEIKIIAKVRNNGTKRLAPVEVEFWAGEERIGEATIDALGPGEKEKVIIWWTPGRSGQYTISAIVDPINRFDESNERNNRDSRTISISGGG